MDPISNLYRTIGFVNFTVNKIGPPHSPSFSVNINIHGKSIFGFGKTIKSAKHAAASAALAQLSDSNCSYPLTQNEQVYRESSGTGKNPIKKSPKATKYK